VLRTRKENFGFSSGSCNTTRTKDQGLKSRPPYLETQRIPTRTPTQIRSLSKRRKVPDGQTELISQKSRPPIRQSRTSFAIYVTFRFQLPKQRESSGCKCCSLSPSAESFLLKKKHRKHAVQDLAPYICLLDKCQAPQEAFGSFKEWLKHMMEESASTSTPFTSCPLCLYPILDQDPKPPSSDVKNADLLLHISGHLQYLAHSSFPQVSCSTETAPAIRQPPLRLELSKLHTLQPLGHLSESARIFTGSDSVQLSKSMNFIPSPHSTQPRFVSQFSTCQVLETIPPGNKNTTGETFTVLHADDNMVNQRLVAALFRKYYQPLFTVSDGQQALDAVMKRKFDVILMDIQMPIMVRGNFFTKLGEH
jgi:hypothetical protein